MTDLFLQLGIFLTFIVFAVCMWLIRKERDKKKPAGKPDAIPPKLSGD